MTVYIDKPRQHSLKLYSSNWWSHIFADTEEELHLFAARLGLNKGWFQNNKYPHYDLNGFKGHKKALSMGAILVSTKEYLRERQKTSKKP